MNLSAFHRDIRLKGEAERVRCPDVGSNKSRLRGVEKEADKEVRHDHSLAGSERDGLSRSLVANPGYQTGGKAVLAGYGNALQGPLAREKRRFHRSEAFQFNLLPRLDDESRSQPFGKIT